MKRQVVVVLLLSGCATGFDRGALKQRLAGEPLAVTDADIERVRALRPQLSLPFKLGVLFLEDDAPGTSRPGRSPAWKWDQRDKEAVLESVESLRAQSIVSDAFIISGPAMTPWNMKAARLAAARYGADAVLIVAGAAQVDGYVNPLAILNLTIIGAYLVPASHRDALFMLRSAMWDVGNEYLYLTVEAEGSGKTVAPSGLIADRDAISEAKEGALRDFQGGLLARMRALHGDVPTSARPSSRPQATLSPAPRN